MASQPPRRKALVLTLVLVPFWTNLLIRTYAWQILLGPHGLFITVASWLGPFEPSQSLYPGIAAVYAAMVCDFLPLLVLPLYASVEKMDWSLVEAARDLGAHGWNVFRHSIWPQIRPGAIAGLILVFLPATGQFVIPDLLGGAKTVLLGNAIQQQFGPNRDWPFGSAIACLAIVLMMLGMWFYHRTGASSSEEESFL